MTDQVIKYGISLAGALTITALFLLAASVMFSIAAERLDRKIRVYTKNKKAWKILERWRDFYLAHADRIKHRRRNTAKREVVEVENAKNSN